MAPLPKPTALRQRRNKVAGGATLSAGRRRRRVPPLPEIDGRDWHPLAVAFWQDTWRSPMADEFVKADIHGLYLLVDLVHRRYAGLGGLGDPSLDAEIRLQRQAFGLTPIDRRRLQWEVEKVEQVTRKAKVRGAQSPIDDPRGVLQVLA